MNILTELKKMFGSLISRPKSKTIISKVKTSKKNQKKKGDLKKTKSKQEPFTPKSQNFLPKRKQNSTQELSEKLIEQ